MPGRATLSNFELMVLLVLMRLGDGAYGIPISEALETETGREVALGSVYNALERLQKKHLVSSSLGDPTAERGGRAKRYFKVTAAGMREIRDARRVLTSLWTKIPALAGRKA